MGVFIIGAGGFSKQVVDAYEYNGIKIEGIFDDSKSGSYYGGNTIIGKISDVRKYGSISLFCGIGDNTTRTRIVSELSDYDFINCIHPKSYVPESTILGKGNYIGPGATIMPDVTVGDFNIVDYSSAIGHDSVIGNCNHICPHSCLGGTVSLGNNIMVGTNATVLPRIKVCNDVIIGAMTLVNKNIEESCTAVGVPFRILNK